MSSPDLTGRSSIPETSVLEPRRLWDAGCPACAGHDSGEDERRHSRGANRTRVLRPSRPMKRAQGMPGAWPHPWPAYNKKSRRQSPQVSHNNRHSLHDGVNATPRSPRCTGLFSHRRLADHSQDLTPASGGQDHTASPSALVSLASRPQSVHRIPHPTFVAIGRNAPLHESARRRRLGPVICPTGQGFFRGGWGNGMEGIGEAGKIRFYA